jgi:hypothetical protein
MFTFEFPDDRKTGNNIRIELSRRSDVPLKFTYLCDQGAAIIRNDIQGRLGFMRTRITGIRVSVE